jgi:sulfur carrier protein
MTVFVNGKEIVLTRDSNTILSLIERYELNPMVVIVERNKEIVRKESYESTMIEEGDRIELVHFVGGG